MKIFNKIKDERLLLKQLKNIRIVFLFENLCIIALLGYNGFRDGFSNLSQNPLWLILVFSGVLNGYLQMGISIDMESDEKKKEQGPYYKKVLVSLAIGVIVGFIMKLCGTEIVPSIISGFVFFVVYLISDSITYYLKKKRLQDLDD